MLTGEQTRAITIAAAEIAHLRGRLEVADAQLAVVEVFRAALLGRPNGGFVHGEDIVHKLNQILEQDKKAMPAPAPMAVAPKEDAPKKWKEGP